MNEEEVREETGQNIEEDEEAPTGVTEKPADPAPEPKPGKERGGRTRRTKDTKPAEPADALASAVPDNGEAENLRRELATAREEAEQLRRERFLLLKGIPEEDLDYYVFKIGKLVTDETDFAAAAGQFLKQREKKTAAGLFRTAARLTGGAPRAATANETMNRLIRGQ